MTRSDVFDAAVSFSGYYPIWARDDDDLDVTCELPTRPFVVRPRVRHDG